ncbi:MAG: thioredoxin-like domain-containing protein [Planctomycetota bacterium]
MHARPAVNSAGRADRLGLWSVLAIFFGAMVTVATIPQQASAQFEAPQLDPNLGWLNTDKPLRFGEELEGHVVLLDFWTYCCINCIHILPDLEYLEQKYADDPFVVVGVHSAKFDTEGTRESIRNAMFRYDIKHPVVIDANMGIWQQYGVRAWPSLVLVGPDGEVIGGVSGEGNRMILDEAIRVALDKGREDGTLADAKVEFALDQEVPSAGGLSFPGKVYTAPIGGRSSLVVADSSHDRVVIADAPSEDGGAQVRLVVGTGERGYRDGIAANAQFNDPQGFAYDAARNKLYIADTKNHAVRTLDLATSVVTTLAGNGVQGYDRRGGGSGQEQRLSSPWDLALDPADGRTLYVAMAGPHQLWKIDVETGKAEAIAGGTGENIIDGPAARAQLAQPSALALSTGTRRLYFADSEVSGVRYLDLDADEVETVIGTGLFDYGDVNGVYPAARLQHNIGLTLLPDADGNDRLLTADTYNDKVKWVEPDEKRLSEWVGVERGSTAPEGALKLNEPGGVHFDEPSGRVYIADTNNHRVVFVDPESGEWAEVVLRGLTPEEDKRDILAGAEGVAIEVDADEPFVLTLSPEVPAVSGLPGKVNEESPVSVRVTAVGEAMEVLASRTQRRGSLPISIDVPATEAAELLVELSYAACTETQLGICVPVSQAWRVMLAQGELNAATITD